MPLLNSKMPVENYKPPKGSTAHTHTCSKCGKVWNCNLNINPVDKEDWASRKPPVNVEKMELVCWWDDDPDCVKCPEKKAA